MKTIIFLVTWIAISIIPVPCPDQQKNDYGFEGVVQLSCDVFHCKEVSKTMDKIFYDEKEADNFIQNMPKGDWGNRCEKIKKERIEIVSSTDWGKLRAIAKEAAKQAYQKMEAQQ